MRKTYPTMQQGICSISLIPMRAEPSSKSEMVSQLLFGETFQVLEAQAEWLFIQNHADQYKGWINHLQFESLEAPCPTIWVQKQFPFLAAKSLDGGAEVFIPFGAQLPIASLGQEVSELALNGHRYLVQTETISQMPLSLAEALQVARQFVNAPYLWGGKSLYGIDCSGFTQIIYKAMGKQLPRDAWQQALEGTTLTFVEEIKAGDLVFFGDQAEKIAHVGIGLGDGNILHASGKVRIDKLDSYGIYHAGFKKHTHVLRNIKRIL